MADFVVIGDITNVAELADANSSASATSTESMTERTKDRMRYVVCVDNSGYPAALEKHKIYRVAEQVDRVADGDIRIVDESGESYLYARERFVPIDVPPEVEQALASAEMGK